jgi:hypothetical protein
MYRKHLLKVAVFAAVFAALLSMATIASQRSAADMARAASQFLSSLTDQQKTKAEFPFDAEERLRWHFIPNEMFPRKGLTIREMNDQQRKLANDLLRTGFSARGYIKVSSIMQLEDVLKIIEGGRFARNKEDYYFAVFGSPGNNGPWGWRVEGHHVSVHFNIVDGAIHSAVASSPTFLGSNPAEVLAGEKKGLRILADEEDTARALLEALAPDQKKIAIINTVAPSDILTMNKNDIAPFAEEGILFGSLDAARQALFLKVIEAYANTMEPDIAAERLAKLKAAGLDKVRFAWCGETERGKKHYYRVQGPTFLIEYDNTQDNANHIHSVWRDFNGDFGRDLLREHLRSDSH